MKHILEVLTKTPEFLEDLIGEIPASRLKKRRIPGKWSIHEHACHLADCQPMMIDRLQTFKNETNPQFTPYLPGTDENPDDHLLEMNLQQALDDFRSKRNKMLELLDSFTDKDWRNQGNHPEYRQYNPRIFVRHIMMHDHFHLYRIEELWLTTDEYL